MTKFNAAGPKRAMSSDGDVAFADFAAACERACRLERVPGERIAALSREFVRGWRMPDPRYLRPEDGAPYASYLLYLAPDARLSIVLDVFLPRQAAVIHNHRCWCVFACLDGLERERLYSVDPGLGRAPVEVASRLRRPGEVTLASAAPEAFHQVECEGDMPAVSLHLYGADIGAIRRQRWDGEAGAFHDFVGGYSNEHMGLPPYLEAVAGEAAR